MKKKLTAVLTGLLLMGSSSLSLASNIELPYTKEDLQEQYALYYADMDYNGTAETLARILNSNEKAEKEFEVMEFYKILDSDLQPKNTYEALNELEFDIDDLKESGKIEKNPYAIRYDAGEIKYKQDDLTVYDSTIYVDRDRDGIIDEKHSAWDIKPSQVLPD